MKIHSAIIALAVGLAVSPLESQAMPLPPVTQTDGRAAAAPSLIEQVQYRRGVRAAPGRVYRGPVRRGGNGNGAAAAIIGLGVLGAIAASQAAPSDCWIERRRVVDDYGRYAGIRRVRVCR